MIPMAAKNAAFLVLASRYPNSDLVYSMDFIRALEEALEAAAPHMQVDPHDGFVAWFHSAGKDTPRA